MTDKLLNLFNGMLVPFGFRVVRVDFNTDREREGRRHDMAMMQEAVSAAAKNDDSEWRP